MNKHIFEKAEVILKHLLMVIYYSHNLDKHDEGEFIISLYMNDLYTAFVSINKELECTSDYEIYIKCVNFVFYREDLTFNSTIIEELYRLYIQNSHKFNKTQLDFFKGINLENYSSFTNSPDFEANLKDKYFDYYCKYMRIVISSSSVNGMYVSDKEIDGFILKKYKRIKNLSKQNGTSELPPNLGNFILGRENTSNAMIKGFINEYKVYMPKLVAEGVTINDIFYWWNQPDVFRYGIYIEDYIKLKMYVLQIFNIEYNYLNAEEKYESVKKENPISTKKGIVEFLITNPIFEAFEYKHNWVLTEYLEGENRPLPYELKDRVLKYITQVGYETLYTMLNKSNCQTTNALIRKKIINHEL